MNNLKSHGVGCEGGNLGSPGSEVRQTLKDVVLLGAGSTCLVIGGVGSGAPPKFLEFGNSKEFCFNTILQSIPKNLIYFWPKYRDRFVNKFVCLNLYYTPEM